MARILRGETGDGEKGRRWIRRAMTGLALVTLAAAVGAGTASAQTKGGISDLHARQLARLQAVRMLGGTPAAVCFTPGTDRELQMAFDRTMWGGRHPAYQTIARWSTTATSGGGLSQGDPTVISYSFVPDGTTIGGLFGFIFGPGPSELHSMMNAEYGGPGVWQPLFHQVFERWSEISGVTYVYEPNDDGADLHTNPGVLGVRGDVRIAAAELDGPSNVLAYNMFPNGGDMVLDSLDGLFLGNPEDGSVRLRNTVAHEAGHGIGLMHVCPIEETKLMEPTISTAFDGPQFDDFLGVQRHYGDVLEEFAAGEVLNLGALPGGGIVLDEVSIDDGLDWDVYTIDIAAPTTVDVTLTPLGTPYLEGRQLLSLLGQCSEGELFDPSLTLNLNFYVIGPASAPALRAFAASNGAGQVESRVNINLPLAGTYTVGVYTSNFNVRASSNATTWRFSRPARPKRTGHSRSTGGTFCRSMGSKGCVRMVVRIGERGPDLTGTDGVWRVPPTLKHPRNPTSANGRGRGDAGSGAVRRVRRWPCCCWVRRWGLRSGSGRGPFPGLDGWIQKAWVEATGVPLTFEGATVQLSRGRFNLKQPRLLDPEDGRTLLALEGTARGGGAGGVTVAPAAVRGAEPGARWSVRDRPAPRGGTGAGE